jgi:hypothetical protein
MNEEKVVTEHVDENDVSFSHMHLVVDSISDLAVYKEMEFDQNRFASAINSVPSLNTANLSSAGVTEARKIFKDIASTNKSGSSINDYSSMNHYVPQNRDVIKQLIVGLGFRVTGMHESVRE